MLVKKVITEIADDSITYLWLSIVSLQMLYMCERKERKIKTTYNLYYTTFQTKKNFVFVKNLNILYIYSIIYNPLEKQSTENILKIN